MHYVKKSNVTLNGKVKMSPGVEQCYILQKIILVLGSRIRYMQGMICPLKHYVHSLKLKKSHTTDQMENVASEHLNSWGSKEKTVGENNMGYNLKWFLSLFRNDISSFVFAVERTLF